MSNRLGAELNGLHEGILPDIGYGPKSLQCGDRLECLHEIV